MPPTPKAVLISLADNANDQGYCWPSIAKISERTCFSKRAVIDAIAWLEQHGILSADRVNGRHTTYVINPTDFAPPVQQAHQCSSRTGASPASEPVQQAHQPVHLPHQPVQQLHTNHQEPSRTVTKSNRQEARASAPALDFGSWPSTPSPDLLAGWLAVRKKKRADVTPIVIAAMAKQLRLAAEIGWTVDECLTECVLRNWQALKVEWLEPKRAGPPGQPPPNAPQSRTQLASQNLRDAADAIKQHTAGLAHQRTELGSGEASPARLGRPASP
jgi:hypothetical protein